MKGFRDLAPDADLPDRPNPYHQLRIDRKSPCAAIEGFQPLADAAEIDEPVNRPQHLIGRHMPLKTEAVKQRFLFTCLFTHDQAGPPVASESDYRQRGKWDSFNRIQRIPAVQRPIIHQCPNNALTPTSKYTCYRGRLLKLGSFEFYQVKPIFNGGEGGI